MRLPEGHALWGIRKNIFTEIWELCWQIIWLIGIFIRDWRVGWYVFWSGREEEYYGENHRNWNSEF